MTTASIINAALRRRCPLPEWALAFNVANGTGGHSRRYADAVAMNLFPSRGLELHGFEVKVSKGDWKRELAQPHKAEEICQYCERWWIVAPKGIVGVDELPVTWGLLELNGDTLRQAKAAPPLTSKAWPRSFIAALMRRSAEIDQGAVDALVNAKIAELRKRDEERFEYRIKERVNGAESKLEVVRKIEERAGISLTDWRATPEYGAMIKILERFGFEKTYGGVHSSLQSLESQLKLVRNEFDALQQLLDVSGPNAVAAQSEDSQPTSEATND